MQRTRGGCARDDWEVEFSHVLPQRSPVCKIQHVLAHARAQSTEAIPEQRALSESFLQLHVAQVFAKRPCHKVRSRRAWHHRNCLETRFNFWRVMYPQRMHTAPQKLVTHAGPRDCSLCSTMQLCFQGPRGRTLRSSPWKRMEGPISFNETCLKIR